MSDFADFLAAKKRAHGIEQVLIGEPGLTAAIALRKDDIMGSVIPEANGHAVYPPTHGV